MQTKIIYDAKIMVVPESSCTIFKCEEPYEYVGKFRDEPVCREQIKGELIKARRFDRMTREKHETWLIGFDEETCRALEMVPSNEIDHYESLKTENLRLKRNLEKIKGSGFWVRLKWLFQGIDKK